MVYSPVSSAAVACMRKVRINTLLIVLIALSGWWSAQYWHGYILWPGQCNSGKPAWFTELVELSRQLGYPGFQLSVQEVDGSKFDCVAGQASQGFSFTPMTADHRMRYASLSKVFTSIVSQQLIEEGRLSPDASLLSYLSSGFSAKDERVQHIKIGHLLRHTAGFDRNVRPDPMMLAEPWCPTNLEELENTVLDHEPGSYYAYSNLGYCLLGAVIEKVEGMPLQDIFSERLFKPTEAVFIQLAERGKLAPDEAKYRYQEPEQKYDLTSMPYESMVASGAWTGRASDFLKVMSQIFPENSFLNDESKHSLLAVGMGCDIKNWRTCHGNAFYAYQEELDSTVFYWRDGSMPGVTSFSGISADGRAVVFIANSRPYDWIPANDAVGLFLYNKIINNRADNLTLKQSK